MKEDFKLSSHRDGHQVMPLNKALWILSEAHTQDDEQLGFTVERLPRIYEWSSLDYVEAWRSVRYNTGK